MAQRVDDLEVGVSLNDRDLVEGIAKAETRVDKFAAKVRKTKPVATVDLGLQKFKIGVREVNAMLKDLSRKDVTVAIKADTRGFLRAYGEVRVAMLGLRGIMNKNIPLFQSSTNFVAKFFNKLGAKGPFENFARGVAGMRVQMGFFSTTVRQAVGVLTVFGPIVEGVLGSLVALAGALGEGLVAAAAVGGSGLAGMAASLLLVKAAITPTTKGIKAAVTAQNAYNTQVQKTGVDSDKAKKKLDELNSTMAHVPASSRAAIRTWATVTSQFREMTRTSAETNVGRVLNAGAQTARSLMPAAAKQTNATMSTIGTAATSAGKAIRGDEIKGQIDTIMSGFNRALPSLLKGFGQLGALLLRIFSAASPFVVDLAKHFAEWATHLNKSNDDAGVLGGTLSRMWGMFKNIVSLLSTSGSLIKTVLGGGADAGDDLVTSLDKTFERWNKILNTPQGQKDMASWFKRASNTAKELGPALIQLIRNAAKFSEATKPIADSILGAVTAIGKFVGAIQSIPGVGPILSLALGFAVVAQKMGLLIPIIKGVRALFKAEMFSGVLTAIGPAGWLLLGLTAIAIGLVAAYKKSETFRDIVNGAWSAVKSAFVSMIDSVLGGLSSMLTAFGKIAKHIPGMKDLGKAALGAAGDIDDLRESLKKVPEKTNVKVKVTIDEVDFAGQATGDAAKNKAFTANGDGLGRAVKAAATSATQRRARTNKGFASKIAEANGALGSGAIPGGKGGNLMGADPRLGGIAGVGGRFGLHVSSGKRQAGGRTSSGGISYHGSGEALDLSNGYATPEELAFFKYMKSHFGGSLAELIHTPGGVGIKNGRPFTYTGQVARDHYDHVHVAVDLPGAGAGGPAASRRGGGRIGNGPARAAIGDGHGRSNAEVVWRYLVGTLGLSPAQAAGVMGNLNQESRFNPNAIEGNGKGPGIGIAQWSHGRASALKAFAAKRHMPWNNLQVQLAFMASEFHGSESAAYAALRGQHTIAGASEAFGRKYERYGVKGDRGGRAFYNRFRNSGGGGATGGGGAPAGPTKAEMEAARKKLQRRIDAIDDKLRAIREKKAALGTGKNKKERDAIKAKRAAYNQQIAKLTGQRVTLARRRRDLPKGRTGPAPALGATGTLADITAEATAAVTAAESTRGLGDDIAAASGLISATGSEVFRDANRLEKVNAALKRPLRPDTRARLLQERQQLITSIATGQQTISDTTSKRAELGIERKFAGGRGRAGLDYLQAVAEGTEGLSDDQGVMQQQLQLWTQLLADRTKRGDIAGMTEAQQQINTINGNLKTINDQVRADYINQGVEAAQTYVDKAQKTTDVFDDVASLSAQAQTLSAAIYRAYSVLDVGAALTLQGQLDDVVISLGDAKKKAEEAPAQARLALAGLTDTTTDDIAATKELLAIHEGRLRAAQAINDYVTIADEAGQVKGLRDALNQAQGDVFAQTRLFSEARADLYRTLGSNYSTITPAGAPMGGRTLTVNNYYKNMPLDAHTWSRDVLFELQAAG